jgi:hypothetical protein
MPEIKFYATVQEVELIKEFLCKNGEDIGSAVKRNILLNARNAKGYRELKGETQ